jgi:hypothetical protein
MIWREGPKGLYNQELFWMEGGKDMEGFQGSFAYGFVKGNGKLLPQDGHLIHPFDTVLAFVSTTPGEILTLGATVSIEIGEERELYTFDQSYIIALPKGTQYGNITVSNFDHAFAFYNIYLTPEYSAIEIPSSELKDPVPGSKKYDGYARLYAWEFDENGEILHDGGAIDYDSKDNSGMGYSKAVDKRGVMHPLENCGPGGMGPGNADELLWVFGDQLQGFELNALWGHYHQCGKWHRGGDAHVHPNEEVLCVVGMDADDPLHIGAEVEIAMGEEDERHFASVPSVWICPKNFPHLPEITRWVDRPYAFFVINNDATHDSPWMDEEGNRIEHE